MEISELLKVDTSQLITFLVLAVIVAVIALVARRGQAHSPGVPPQNPDYLTRGNADQAGGQRSAASDTGARPTGEPAAKRPERGRR